MRLWRMGVCVWWWTRPFEGRRTRTTTPLLLRVMVVVVVGGVVSLGFVAVVETTKNQPITRTTTTPIRTPTIHPEFSWLLLDDESPPAPAPPPPRLPRPPPPPPPRPPPPRNMRCSGVVSSSCPKSVMTTTIALYTRESGNHVSSNDSNKTATRTARSGFCIGSSNSSKKIPEDNT